MAQKLKFAKLCCGGNDFIVIDFRDTSPPGNLSSLTRVLCARRTGIGADGLIALVSDTEHPFGTTLFNADGSRAEVSYNGSRCVGRYACETGIVPGDFRFASGAGPIDVHVEGAMVKLEVPPPEEIRTDLTILERGETVRGHAIRAGVPYFVIFLEDLSDPWIEDVPPRLRINPAFPKGTNVAVASRKVRSRCEARFFERGVPEETPSSGSGCVAVALLTALLWSDISPVSVKTEGGDFTVSFSREDNEFRNVSTAGEVHFLFSGEIVD